jgi:hypothetical protein
MIVAALPGPGIPQVVILILAGATRAVGEPSAGHEADGADDHGAPPGLSNDLAWPCLFLPDG